MNSRRQGTLHVHSQPYIQLDEQIFVKNILEMLSPLSTSSIYFCIKTEDFHAMLISSMSP